MDAIRFSQATLLGLALSISIACDQPSDALPDKPETPVAQPHQQDAALTDKAIDPVRLALLDLAIDTANAMPANPHVKDRSLKQREVIDACLKLDQPLLAEKYLQDILNYEKGVALARVAKYAVEHGHNDHALKLANQALVVSENRAIEVWRRTRIRVETGQVFVLLGDTEKSQELGLHVDDFQRGRIEQAHSQVIESDDLDAHIESLDALAGAEDMEMKRNAIEGLIVLHKRFYKDTQRRDRLEQLIFDYASNLPIMVRVPLFKATIESAMENGDQPRAVAMIDRLEAEIDKYNWQPRYKVPVESELVKLRFLAEDRDRAKQDADAALAHYEEHRESIETFWRGGAIRPLAEAYMIIGHHESAAKAYEYAVSDGAINPNARPRCEDLSSTSVSMALSGFQPSDELMNRMRKERERLGPPW